MKYNYGEKLQMWQNRLVQNRTANFSILNTMDEREMLYSGTRQIGSSSHTNGYPIKNASNVRNIVAEIIETQVDSNIPQPKVTARREKDEQLAKLIEDYLRNEINRLPFEIINDLDERTTPIQGGDIFLIEWDSRAHTHKTVGELSVTLIHPKQFIPQSGVNRIEDMDYFIIQMPQTKEYINQKYGKNVYSESEENPDSRGGTVMADDIVTENTAYYKNSKGGIGRFVWVNDIILEDAIDYQSRRIGVCGKCGKFGMEEKCKFCSSTDIVFKECDFEEIDDDIIRSDGSIIPSMTYTGNSNGNVKYEMGQNPIFKTTVIPFYKPDIFPIVMRKNVSVFGQLYGDSDVDKIRDQQEAIKKAETRIDEKLSTGGSIFGMSENAKIELTDRQMKVVRFKNPQDEAMTRVFNLQADTLQDLQYISSNYESARNVIGITDSFQGRRDTTATSGKAKEFSAAQSAGRLESKRTMKNATYADIFQIMFKFLLAYADELRPVASRNSQGKTEYKTFNRYDFLEMDEAGEYFWNDEFLFSVDSTAPLASNREAMWEETRKNLADGAFGNPSDLKTLILFWTKMEMLHYPGAGDSKNYIEERFEKEVGGVNDMQEMRIGIKN